MSVWVITSSYPRFPTESINAGVVARDLALAIHSSGHDVTVITPDKPGGVEFDHGLRGLTVSWLKPSVQIADLSKRPLDLARASSLIANGRRTLTKAASVDPPDGIIALWGLPSGMFARWAARKASCPYVVWLLGSDVWRADDIPGGRGVLSRVLLDASASFADGIELANEAKRITSVQVEFLPSARRLPSPTVESPGLLDVLFVGRYHPNKGPDILLNALGVLSKRGSVFTAEFHGSGGLEGLLQRQLAADELGSHVTIHSPIDAQSFANRLACARVLVIPSRVESIPLVLGDAIQSRTPVVATRVGDMGDLVDELGIGLTVDPDSPEDMAGAIETIVEGRYVVTDWSRADDILSPSAAPLQLLSSLDL